MGKENSGPPLAYMKNILVAHFAHREKICPNLEQYSTPLT